MSGIYIPGLSMPRKTGIVSIVLSGDGSALLCEDGAYSEIKVIPVPEHGQVLKVLKTERECVSRNCDRECGKCDLSLERDEIITAYDVLVSMLGSVKEETE